MRRSHIYVSMLSAAGLLAACAHKPAAPPLAVTPLLRIDDARAALAARAAQPARQPVAAPTPAPAAQPPAVPVTPSRMELVQLGPNEYRLQYRQPPAVAANAAAPTTTPAPASAAATPPRAPATAAALEVVNGNGVRGIAAHVRRVLLGQGIPVAQVSSQRGYAQRITVIDYLPGQQARARAVQTALHGHATLRPARTLPNGMALRLVLGRDHAARLAALAAGPHIKLAALPPAPHFNQE